MKCLATVLLCILGLSTVQSIPFLEKDLVWFPTDDGRILPAFLKETGVTSVIEAIEDDVEFWHFLPGETDAEGRQIHVNCDDGCLSSFTQNAPLILVAHGWGSGHLGGLGRNIRAGFGNRSEPVNIVLINYSKLSPSLDYGTSVKNIEPVGEYVATFINYLVGEGVATLDQTYFIGHSLGAHVPNYITPNLNGGKMKTIFGLDPAWPLFDRRDDSGRLDPSDAQFVNVLHTSTVYLGFKDPTGHADFYPNAGHSQPGCDDNFYGDCSHSIVVSFFGESILNSEAFASCSCSSWEEFNDGSCACDETTVMGWHTPATARGVFYLRTNPQRPYGQ